MDKLTTWGQALDYTFATRDTWRHGNGRKTALINSGHFTRLRGRSFPISKISQPVVTQVCIELEDEGKSDATINRIVSAVSTVLNHLAFDGLISGAPKFRRRKENEHRFRWYTKDEVEQLHQAALDPFDRQDLAHIIVAAAYTGMRRAELLTVQAMDIDLATWQIHVGGRPGFTTKARNYRVIPIHERIRGLVSDRLQYATPSVKLFGDEWTGGDQLLRAYNKARNYIRKDETYCFHTLRHSFATWCNDAGVPVRTIMDLMGHKRVETTLRYAKVSDQARQVAILAI